MSAGIFNKENFSRLTGEERSRLMRLQMSPSYYPRDGSLPDDCSECGACGAPMLGSGWCNYCSDEYESLVKKVRGETNVL